MEESIRALLLEESGVSGVLRTNDGSLVEIDSGFHDSACGKRQDDEKEQADAFFAPLLAPRVQVRLSLFRRLTSVLCRPFFARVFAVTAMSSGPVCEILFVSVVRTVLFRPATGVFRLGVD